MGRTTGTKTKKTSTRKISTRSRKVASIQEDMVCDEGPAVVADEFQHGRGTPRRPSNSSPTKVTKPSTDGRDPILLEETSSDVLLGRGSGIARHPGNVYFRHLVALYRPTYQKEARNRKMDIANIIIAKIQGTSPPGRFLEPSKQDPTRFIQVDKKRALEKTSQALREKPSVPSKQKKDNKRRYALKSMAEVSAANAAFTLIAAAAEAVRKREVAAEETKLTEQPSERQATEATPPWVEQRMNSLSELELAAVMDLTTLSYRAQRLNEASRTPPRTLASPAHEAVSTTPNVVSPELSPKETIDATSSHFRGGISNLRAAKAEPENCPVSNPGNDAIFL